MQSLLRQIRRPQLGGEEMPVVFEALAQQGANARRGEVTLLVGEPEAGKSAVALWLALQWAARHGQRGLYWSADTTPFVAGARSVAALGAAPNYKAAEKALRAKEPKAMDALRALSRAGLEWCFDAFIDNDSLVLNSDAFLEKWGQHPDFVIIDNLTDADTGQEGDEFSALRGMMRDLNFMARRTNAAMVALHHTSEGVKSNESTGLPPRKATHGKVSVKPTVMLATARSDGTLKPIGPVKNRYGISDKTGGLAFDFVFDPETFQFKGSAGRRMGT